MSDSPEEKKLIIDEDWKTQAQAEKEAVQKQAEEKAEEPEAGEQGQIPPADFTTLLSMLATQAMMAMGVVPHPITGQAEVHLDQAKHFIDFISLLHEKTEGNLTDEEKAMIENLIHEMRMAFVAVQSGAMNPPPAGPEGTATPELG